MEVEGGRGARAAVRRVCVDTRRGRRGRTGVAAVESPMDAAGAAEKRPLPLHGMTLRRRAARVGEVIRGRAICRWRRGRISAGHHVGIPRRDKLRARVHASVGRSVRVGVSFVWGWVRQTPREMMTRYGIESRCRVRIVFVWSKDITTVHLSRLECHMSNRWTTPGRQA